MVTHSFTYQGKDYSVELPDYYTIESACYVTSLKKDREALKQLKKETKLQRFSKNASDTIKSFLAVALAAAPNFALKTAAFILPLLVTAFLHHYGLYDKIGKLENYPSTFPSETYLRGNMHDMAADNLVWLAHELDDKKVYLSCDKGKFYCTCCFLLCQTFRLTSCCCYP